MVHLSAWAVGPTPPPDGPPAALLTGVSVSGAQSVDEESDAQYTCVATYSDGSVDSVDAVWSTDSEVVTMSSNGLMTVGSIDVDCSVIVTAVYGGKAASISVNLNDVAPALSGLTITGPVSLDEGTTAAYSCSANWSDGTTSDVIPVWSVDSSYASISDDGFLSASDVPSDQSVIISASYGGVTASNSVTVTYVAPTLSGISISGPISLDEGTTAGFSCSASWSDGVVAEVVAVWSEDSPYASISGDGVLSASDVTSDQSVTVVAAYGGMTDTQTVTIHYVAPTLSSITISGPVSLDEESTAAYSCTANWSDGTTTAVSPVWSESSPYASISSDGVLSASDVDCDQTFEVTALYGGLTDVYPVSINYIAPVTTEINIVGISEMDENSTNGFVCVVTYSDGSVEEVQPEWSVDASFAIIDEGGSLFAGNISEDAIVTVTASYDGCNASRSVSVRAVGTQIVYPLIGYEGETLWARLWDETAQQWTELGVMADPDELVIEGLESGRWYWVSIRMYNESNQTWDSVQGNWLWM
ncbi:MAG: hypothetical protein JXR25_03815 [Pontiellaceae bacterium]|nr:hypothetical protein [Pontiellaceae bacterium]MBN2783928.1 hypothetical protein [Pontiellaceae bacterium]